MALRYCQHCEKPISRQDSFVFLEHEQQSKEQLPPQQTKSSETSHFSIANFHFSVTRRESIQNLIDDLDTLISQTKRSLSLFEDEEFHVETSDITKAKLRSFNDRSSSITKDTCMNCWGLIYEELEKQLQEDHSKKTRYLRLMDSIVEEEMQESSISDEMRIRNEKIETELLELEKEEVSLLKMVEDLSAKKASLSEDLKGLRKVSDAITEEENNFWEELTKFELTLQQFKEEKTKFQSQIGYASKELQRLEQRNVHQDTFFISTNSKVGMINNFRFGQLPNSSIHWEEINAAWGMCTLLLYSIMKKVGFVFSRYILHPQGNRSSIEDKQTHAIYVLHGSSGDDIGFAFGTWFRSLAAAATRNVMSGSNLVNSNDDSNATFLSRSSINNISGNNNNDEGNDDDNNNNNVDNSNALSLSNIEISSNKVAISSKGISEKSTQKSLSSFQISSMPSSTSSISSISTSSSTFDDGMTAFLFCTNEIGEYATSISKGTFSLPYKIQKDKIEGKSIRMNSNTVDSWTAALKLMLADLNFLLAWCSTFKLAEKT